MRKNTNYQAYNISKRARSLILAAYPLTSDFNWTTYVDYLNMRSELLDTIELFEQLGWVRISFNHLPAQIWIDSNLQEQHDLYNQVTSMNDQLLREGFLRLWRASIKKPGPSGQILVEPTTTNRRASVKETLEVFTGDYVSRYVENFIPGKTMPDLQAEVNRLTNVLERCLGGDLSTLELIIHATNAKK
jgi:hypothetical protein